MFRNPFYLTSRSIITQILLMLLLGQSDSNAFAQDCPNGDVVIESQQELDSLKLIFVDCPKVQGDLILRGFYVREVSSFLSLLDTIEGDFKIDGVRDSIIQNSSLEFVGGAMSIVNSYWLLRAAFDGLLYIGGDLNIQQNGKLNNCSMDLLKEIGGCLFFYKNQALSSFDFGSLRWITHSLGIRYNDGAEDITFDSLEAIGGLQVYGNNSLENFALPKIKSIDGYVEVITNNSLKQFNLDGIDRLTGVAIYLNPQLELIDLCNLDSVSTSLYISLNKKLKTVTLSHLTHVGLDLNITEHDSIYSIGVFSDLLYIGNNLYISDNPLLTDCSVLCPLLMPGIVKKGIYIMRNGFGCGSRLELEQACQEIGFEYPVDTGICPIGDVVISTQEELDTFVARFPLCRDLKGRSLSISGSSIVDLKTVSEINSVDDYFGILNTSISNLHFENLRSVGKQVYIRLNPELTSVQLIQLDSIGSGIRIDENDALAAIDLPKLSSVRQDFAIYGNKTLTALNISSLNSLESFILVRNDQMMTLLLPLVSLGKSLTISNNQSLVSVTAYDLQVIGNDMRVSDNPTLESINFRNLKSVGGTLGVTVNPLLSECSTLCPVIVTDGIGNYSNFGGNAEGCDDLGQVKSSCNDYCFENLTLDQFLLNSYHVGNNLNLSGLVHSYRQLEFSSGQEVNVSYPFEVIQGGVITIQMSGCSH